MDNASKALVMAGAILISVMLISLGVYLFNIARDQATGTSQQLDVYKVTSYNERYTAYFGKNKSLSQVNSLVALVNAHNTNQTEVQQYGGVVSITASGIVGGGTGGTYSANGANARTSGFYQIELVKTDTKSGCINGIKITYFAQRQAD